MPFIVMKRDDMPNGTTQVIDLFPNTAQRNYTVDPPGHTKYLRKPDASRISMRTIAGDHQFRINSEGLAAWFAVNVPSVAFVYSQGTVTAADALGTVGDLIAIAGIGALVAVSGARTPGIAEYSIDNPASTTGIADSIAAAINDVFSATLSATSLAGVVTIDSKQAGIAGNAVITLTLGSAGHLTKTDLAGGIDGSALNQVQANADAQDILGLIEFGTTNTPGELTLAAINGVITTGVVLSGQRRDLMKVIAGARYLAPKGTITATAGIYGVAYPTGSIKGIHYGIIAYRETVEGGDLELSRLEGFLSKLLSTDYIHRGTSAQAVILYNEDGTLKI